MFWMNTLRWCMYDNLVFALTSNFTSSRHWDNFMPLYINFVDDNLLKYEACGCRCTSKKSNFHTSIGIYVVFIKYYYLEGHSHLQWSKFSFQNAAPTLMILIQNVYEILLHIFFFPITMNINFKKKTSYCNSRTQFLRYFPDFGETKKTKNKDLGILFFLPEIFISGYVFLFGIIQKFLHKFFFLRFWQVFFLELYLDSPSKKPRICFSTWN